MRPLRPCVARRGSPFRRSTSAAGARPVRPGDPGLRASSDPRCACARSIAPRSACVGSSATANPSCVARSEADARGAHPTTCGLHPRSARPRAAQSDVRGPASAHGGADRRDRRRAGARGRRPQGPSSPRPRRARGRVAVRSGSGSSLGSLPDRADDEPDDAPGRRATPNTPNDRENMAVLLQIGGQHERKSWCGAVLSAPARPVRSPHLVTAARAKSSAPGLATIMASRIGLGGRGGYADRWC